jgi:putative transposase
MANKKHTTAQIASKLAQADQMSAQGKLQVEIARALDVSVMTLHRWRKLSLDPPGAVPAEADQENSLTHRQSEADQIAELQLENSRLRRLVTDLLLEKMKREEAASAQPNGRSSNIQARSLPAQERRVRVLEL